MCMRQTCVPRLIFAIRKKQQHTRNPKVSFSIIYNGTVQGATEREDAQYCGINLIAPLVDADDLIIRGVIGPQKNNPLGGHRCDSP